MDEVIDTQVEETYQDSKKKKKIVLIGKLVRGIKNGKQVISGSYILSGLKSENSSNKQITGDWDSICKKVENYIDNHENGKFDDVKYKVVKDSSTKTIMHIGNIKKKASEIAEMLGVGCKPLNSIYKGS